MVGCQGLLGHCTIHGHLCHLPSSPASHPRGTASHSQTMRWLHTIMPLLLPQGRRALWAGLSSPPGQRWTSSRGPPCSTLHTLRAENGPHPRLCSRARERQREGDAPGWSQAQLLLGEKGLRGQCRVIPPWHGKEVSPSSGLGPALPPSFPSYSNMWTCL